MLKSPSAESEKKKLNNIIKTLLPNSVVERIQYPRSMNEWAKRDYLENAPQLVKHKFFERYGVRNAVWVETGTYMGLTTEFLRKKYPHVHSIEPSEELYNNAARLFNGKNVPLYNDVSENVMPNLLPSLKGNINFWLDGHYSAGVTFRGAKDCPVEAELNAIEASAINFDAVAILIDDVRCFLKENDTYVDYPSIDYLVDWARKFKYRWRIVHDIFIMQKTRIT